MRMDIEFLVVTYCFYSDDYYCYYDIRYSLLLLLLHDYYHYCYCCGRNWRHLLIAFGAGDMLSRKSPQQRDRLENTKLSLRPCLMADMGLGPTTHLLLPVCWHTGMFVTIM